MVERIRLTVRLIIRLAVKRIRLVVTKVIKQLGIVLTKVIEQFVLMGKNFIDTILGLVLHTGLGRRNSSFMVIQQVVFKLIGLFPIFTNLNLRGLTY
jgi:hypothetical protein